MPVAADLREFYVAYNDVCNRHAFSELGPFVHDRLQVNGRVRTRAEYAADLGEVVAAFPDYARTVRRMVVEAPWVSVHLSDRGTYRGPFLGQAPSGRPVRTDEFAMYRVEGGRIAEIWVTADNWRLLHEA
jgi:predicted ester cyclase